MGGCSAGDDDDDAAAADGVGGALAVSANRAVILTLSVGVLLLSLILCGAGGIASGSVRMIVGCGPAIKGPPLADDGPAEALRPLRAAGAGAMMVGTTPPLP